MLVKLVLEKKSFEYYYCKKQLNLGIDIGKFSKILNTCDKTDVITITIYEENEYMMHIKFDNGHENSCFEHTLKLLSIPAIEEDEDHTPYELSGIYMESNKFQSIIKKLNTLATRIKINIQLVDNQIRFTYIEDKEEGLQHTLTKIIGDQRCEEDDYDSDDEGSGEIIDGTFLLDNLLLCTKATQLNKHVNICFAMDKPLILNYKVGNLGTLSFINQNC